MSRHCYYTISLFFRLFCEDVYPEHLDYRGSAEDLEEGEPYEHLPHSALGDRSVVELGELQVARVHRLYAGELKNVLKINNKYFF